MNASDLTISSLVDTHSYNLKRRVLLAGFLISAVMLASTIYNLIAIDSCVDAGGVFDYQRRSCRFDVRSLAPAARITDYPLTMIASLSTMLIFGALVLRVSRKRKGFPLS